MSTINRDTWLKCKPAVKTDLIKQKLVLPAFEYNCGHLRGSAHVVATGSPLRGQTMTFNPTNALTLDFYIYITKEISQASYYVLRLSDEVNARGVDISVDNATDTMIFEVITSLSTYTLNLVPTDWTYNHWYRVTLTFSSVDNLAKIYLNGIYKGEVATTGVLGTNSHAILFGNTLFLSYLNAYVADVRLHNAAKTDSQIYSGAGPVGSFDTSLKHYWKLTSVSGGNWDNLIGTVDLQGSGASLEENIYPPELIFGASFVAAQYEVNLGKTCSFKFPVRAPEADHSLVIRWEDDEENIVRRYLYKPSGVDFDQGIVEYSGEKVNDPFFLEIWNIDGAATATLTEDLNLYISCTTAPTTVIDRASEEAATLTGDSELAEVFPLANFPLEFNTQQTYN